MIFCPRGYGLVGTDKDGQDVQLSNISLMAWARIKDVDAEIHGVIFVIKFHVSNAIKWIFVRNDQLENQKKNIENMILMAIPDNDHWIDLQNSSYRKEFIKFLASEVRGLISHNRPMSFVRMLGRST